MKVAKVMKLITKIYNHKRLKIINHKLVIKLIKLLKILIFLKILMNNWHK